MRFTEEKIEEAKHPDEKEQYTAPGKTGLWLGAAFAIVLLDQLSKWAVTEYMIRPVARGASHASRGFFDWYMATPSVLPYAEIKITSFFNIVMVWNTGVSFGMMGGMGKLAPLLLILLAAGITLLFTRWLIAAETNFQRFCYILVIGGALGNIIDRARYGAVIDFLDFHAAGYHWPAFNVADSAVVTGIFLLIAGLCLTDVRRKKRLHNKLKKRQARQAKCLWSF